MTIRKLTSILFTALILFGASSAFATDYKTKLTLKVANRSTVYDETYTFEAPADFTITQSGWNELGAIKASYSGSNKGFDTKKKLVVTVTSTNDFKLTASGVTDTISYFHATSSDDTSATTTFEFTVAAITKEGTSKTVGVNVEDYSKKANGTYTDEITYTVEVKDALLSLTVRDFSGSNVGNQTFYYVEGETWRQALTNHPTENAGWQIDSDTYVQYKQTTYYIFDDNADAPGLDTVIDASKKWHIS